MRQLVYICLLHKFTTVGERFQKSVKLELKFKECQLLAMYVCTIHDIEYLPVLPTRHVNHRITQYKITFCIMNLQIKL